MRYTELSDSDRRTVILENGSPSDLAHAQRRALEASGFRCGVVTRNLVVVGGQRRDGRRGAADGGDAR